MRIKGNIVNKTKQENKTPPRLVQCGVSFVEKLCLPISIDSCLYIFEAETEILPVVQPWVNLEAAALSELSK